MRNSSFCCCQRLKRASTSPVRTCPLCSETVPRDARSCSPALLPWSLRRRRRRWWIHRRCPTAASSRWTRSCCNTGCAPRTEAGTTWAPWRPGIRAGWAGRSSGGWPCRRACARRRPPTWRAERRCRRLRLCRLSSSSSAWSCRCRTSSHSSGPASSSFLYLESNNRKRGVNKYGRVTCTSTNLIKLSVSWDDFSKTSLININKIKMSHSEKNKHIFALISSRLTGVILVTCHLLEAVIQWQVVPDRVLPSSLALLIEREVVSHVLIDLTQSQLFVLGVLYGHGDQRRVGIRRSDHLEELLLARDGQPAQIRAAEPGGRRQELPLVRPVSGLDVGRAVVSGQVRRRVDAGSVQPQVRVRRRWGVLSEAVAGGVRRRPLRVMVVQVLLVHPVVVAVDGHVQELLSAVVLNRAGLLVGWLVSKSVHNPP